jgi:plastocyanin
MLPSLHKTSLAFLLAAACSGDRPTSPAPDAVDVYASGSVFTPPSAEIGVGGTVRFHMVATSEGEGHNAIFSRVIAGAPADINVVVGETVSRTFNTRGTFAYVCTVHPGMSGEVVVH